MAVLKNEIPILECDSDPEALLRPDSEHRNLRLPERAVLAFAGEAVDRYAQAQQAVIADRYISISKEYPFYLLGTDAGTVCLAEAPVGAPAAVQIMDCLLACGVRKIIAGGSCGVLTDIPENSFLIPRRALRDEGTSYHYLPPSRYAEISERARAAIAETLNAHGLPCTEVTTWSTDGYFRETKEMVEYRRSEGCASVEMECAALAACAQMRGAEFGEILFTADSLANAAQYDKRGFGRASVEYALQLCVEAVQRL